jgi:hypothetical protein
MGRKPITAGERAITMSFSVTMEQFKVLTKLAKKDKVSMSQFIRDCMDGIVRSSQIPWQEAKK